MFKLYLASAIAAFGLYGFAQYKGWSMFASEAQDFQRARAEQAYGSSRGGWGGGFGGSSGHK